MPSEVQSLSVRAKLIFVLIGIVVLIQIIAAVLNFSSLRRRLEQNLTAEMEKIVSLVNDIAEARIGEFDVPGLESLVDYVASDPNVVYAVFLDTDGQPITHLIEKPLLPPAYTKVFGAPIFSRGRDGQKVGSFEVAYSTRPMIASLREALYLVGLQTFALVLLLGAATVFFFDRLIEGPLLGVLGSAKKAASGDLSFEIPVRRMDEFGVLGSNFNQMIRVLRAHRDGLEELVQTRTRELSETNEQLIQKVAEVQRTRYQMIQSSKLSALGQMAGGIAHEINNPLSIILLKASKLKEELGKSSFDPASAIREVDKINEISIKISRIIKAMKNFSHDAKKDPKALVPVKILIEETIELCGERFRSRGIALRVGEIPDLKVVCRQSEVVQVIFNLLINAYDALCAKHDPDGGWVRVDFDWKEGRQVLLIFVTDSGNGIPPQIASHLMEPFFTTKPPGEGSGLGLSVAKRLMESHGGDITLDVNSQNTRFVITLRLT